MVLESRRRRYIRYYYYLSLLCCWWTGGEREKNTHTDKIQCLTSRIKRERKRERPLKGEKIYLQVKKEGRPGCSIMARVWSEEPKHDETRSSSLLPLVFSQRVERPKWKGLRLLFKFFFQTQLNFSGGSNCELCSL